MKRPRQFPPGLVSLSVIWLSLLATLLRAQPAVVAPTDCSELLQDGGFEAGGQGWVQYSAQGYELISDFNPRTTEWLLKH